MYLSVKTRKVYEDRLEELNKKRIALAQEKQSARDENAGYEEKKLAVGSVNEEIHRVSAEMESIKKILKEAIMVERQVGIDDVVDLGDKVTIAYEGDPEPYTFELVSTYINDGNVSISSPLGKAVYGKRVGDVCNYVVNLKRTVKRYSVTILGLENAQEIEDQAQPDA